MHRVGPPALGPPRGVDEALCSAPSDNLSGRRGRRLSMELAYITTGAPTSDLLVL